MEMGCSTTEVILLPRLPERAVRARDQEGCSPPAPGPRPSATSLALQLLLALLSLSRPPSFGVACHLGVLTDLPCIGVAKKLLQVDGLENNALHKEKIRLLKAGGDSFPLMGGSGTVLGMALKSHDHSTKPLYVSVGHKMSLEAAVRLTHGCCKFRIPEPVRQADIRSRDYIRRTLGVQGAPALQPERSKKAQRPKACPQGVSEEPAVSCCVVNCSVKSTWQRTEPTCQSPCEGAILEVHPPALLKPSDAPSPGCHLTATS
ncbi:endonuclease V isoform X7 [Eschrichtius robustus]